MLSYIIRRLLLLPLTLIGVTVFIFNGNDIEGILIKEIAGAIDTDMYP